MTPTELYLVLAVGTGVVLVSVTAARLATRLGMPVLLAYLGVGLLLGQDGLGLPFDDAALAQALGLAALAVILVEGGLTTDVKHVRPVLAPATVLATLGVLVSVALTAVAAYLLLDVGWQTALLLGAIVSSTDAAAVFSVLRAVPLPKRLTSLVEAESGLNDAPTFILVLTFSATGLAAIEPLPLLAAMIFQLAAGGAIGLAVGAAGVWLLRRLTLPTSGLHPIAIVGCGVLAYAVAGLTQTSGFLAAYLAGLVLGNAGLPHRRATRSVAEGLGWIAQIGLFVMLGLLVTPSELGASVVPALVVGAALLLVARPVSVLLSLAAFRVPLREQVFLSWAGLRGAVPIVLATIPVVADSPGSDRVFNIVFLLVVVFTIIQAPALPWLARRLRLTPHDVGPDLQVELAPLDAMDADLIHVTVEPGSRLQGVYLPELRLPPPAATTLVVRGPDTFVPDEHTRLRVGDQLVVLTTPRVREATERRLRAVARGGRLAGWFGETGDPEPATPTGRRRQCTSNA
ncbi:potassium/proton antiporter [Micromonospora sp. 15K316]|uniref:potassium/proton antiporter n=1 Tax=Micromonospora sp. 15K316 TaxID=2530376 RepID=UPI00104782AE|nr:potassium/proton antiporter [Micromonospora sp. 15K316]TDC37527.1 potassium/proton antiporter [Micromonospora sp. 15K316]